MTRLLNRKRSKLLVQMGDIKAEYRMSQPSRFVRHRTGLPPQGAGADWHYRQESKYYKDIEQCQDLIRNDAVIGQLIERAVANIVQEGFTLDPKTGSGQLDEHLKGLWQEWGQNPQMCDVAGELTWHDHEMHAVRAILGVGDIWAHGLEDGCLQMFESHNIRNPQHIDNTFLGVTKDEDGRAIQVHVIEDPLDPRHATDQTPTAVDVYSESGVKKLFQIYHPKRVRMTRGVSALAPIFEMAGMFEDTQFAKLIQEQVAACFVMFRKRAPVHGLPSGKTSGYGESSTEVGQGADGSIVKRHLEGIAPATEVLGLPGEDVEFFSPNITNEGYHAHIRSILQIISVNLGLPLCLALMDGSETNFSGWRGAVDEARKGFRENQINLWTRLHKPVYLWKLRQWAETDPMVKSAWQEVDSWERGGKRQALEVNPLLHRWNPPTWQYIDPVGDAQGDILQSQNTLSSLRRLHAARGNDWNEIVDEEIEDRYSAIVKAKTAAQDINNRFPDNSPVYWWHLINLPTRDGIQMNMQDPQILDARNAQSLEERETQKIEDKRRGN